MAFFDKLVDEVSPWLYNLFASDQAGQVTPTMQQVPNSPLANTPDTYAPPAMSTPTGILQSMPQSSVPNSPMANAPDQMPKDPSAHDTLQGMLATMGGDGSKSSPDDDRATNRRIALLGMGLKAAGELVQQQMNAGYDVSPRLPGRSIPSGVFDMHDALNKKRLAALHPVDWSQYLK